MTQAQLQTEPSTSLSSDEIEVVMIPPHGISPWADAQIREHLGPAIELSHGRIKIEQVFYLIGMGRAQLWFAMDAGECITVIVTEIIEWVSGRRCLKVMLAGGFGSLDRAMGPVMRKLEEFAMFEVCSSVLVEGRKGWGRTLPAGYQFSHAAFEKELF